MTPDRAAALGTEPVGRLLARHAVQTTFAVGMYGVYSLTNAFFVARFVGPVALAAVNVSAPIVMLVGGLATMIGTGGASVLSRALGAGDLERAARTTGTSLVAYWVGSLMLGLVGIACLHPLVRVLGATDEVAADATAYAVIILAGAVTATGFSNLVRAEGRVGFSTLEWIIPIVTHIVLDPVFIIGFGLGVRGAAIGTLGGQLVSAAMGVWFFLVQRHRPYRVRARDLLPDPRLLREILAVGTPSLVAGLGTTLLTVVTNNLLAVAGGATALGAYAIAARVGIFVTMPQLGIAQAMQPIVGYNYGAARGDRARRATTLSMLLSLVSGTVATVAVGIGARPLAQVFTDDAATVATSTTALGVLALGYPVSGVVTLTAAWYQSRGAARGSFILSVGTVLAVKLPVLLLVAQLGIPGIWWAFPSGELVSALAGAWLWRRSLRGLEKSAHLPTAPGG